MKKIFKISACFLAAVIVLSTAVFAENGFSAGDVSFKDGLIFIGGKTPSANMSIAVSAVKNGGDRENAASLCYVDEILSDENSSYEISFDLKDAPSGETLTGEYVLYLQCGKDGLRIPFKYSDYRAVLSLITSAENADEIYKILQNEDEFESLCTLGFDMELYRKIDTDKRKELCKLFFDGKSGSGAKEVTQKFSQSLAVVLITTKDEQNILSGLKIINPAVGDAYFNDITDEVYKNFAVQCMAQDEIAADFEKVNLSFKKADALCKINTASAGEVFGVIKEKADVLQIADSEIYSKWLNLSENENTAACVKLVNILGKSRAKTASALAYAMEEALKSDSGGSSGGSSKGGSSGGSYNLSGTSGIVPQKEKFSDLNSVSWAKDAILSLADKNIVSGYDDGTFLPNNFIKREEFTKIIVTAFDISDAECEISFSDVNENEWYYQFIKRAYGANIIKGISEESFGVSGYITRQDIAVMLSRILEKYGENLKSVREYAVFCDQDEISGYAADGIKKLYCLGIISGYEDGSVRPMGNATRAEAAYMINGILGAIN